MIYLAYFYLVLSKYPAFSLFLSLPFFPLLNKLFFLSFTFFLCVCSLYNMFLVFQWLSNTFNIHNWLFKLEKINRSLPPWLHQQQIRNFKVFCQIIPFLTDIVIPHFSPILLSFKYQTIPLLLLFGIRMTTIWDKAHHKANIGLDLFTFFHFLSSSFLLVSQMFYLKHVPSGF